GKDFITSPAPTPTPSAPAQEGTAEGEDVEIGGEDMTIENWYNPVPEIAENLEDSVVGIEANSYEMGQLVSSSRGTGFIISKEGYILTNYHVASDSQELIVTLHNGVRCEAEYLGGDSTQDVAVIKIEQDGLKAVSIGKSADTKVGELVVAIGNPSGAGENLVGSVTVGYVSAVDRELLFNGSRQKFIQTDAAINPGNSGGPLVNSKGQVIGMVTLKSLVSSMDANGESIDAEGIGFAIPIDAAVDTAEKIIEGGSIKKPGIGVWYGTMTEEEREAQGLPDGLLVQGFMEGSPAEAAGMRVGDVIVACDGQRLEQGADLADIISRKQIGDTVTLTVWRSGNELDITITLVDINSMR
ncbi:MAG: trypsin-like peptidase domain-containing protein, partial [Christensenellaceae bacterium]|nr:trypsin-like peptidase domain-containing protein [Christensenellaceae bacterium]